MVNEEFQSLQELYERVFPALHSKREELRIQKLPFITEKIIWNCLMERKWHRNVDLTLFDIVNDILNITEKELIIYMNEKSRN